MIIHILKARRDNYIYILHDEKTHTTVAVDPSEATPVIEFLNTKNWHLNCILNTHHHGDHVGGNIELKKLFNCEIFCSDYDFHRIPGATKALADQAEFKIGSQMCRVLATPGHTLGAIVYYFTAANVAFTGDTLFTLGCGRLFEGTAPQLWSSLQRLTRDLNGQTMIYSGHEFGLQNAAFAQVLNPSSLSTQALLKQFKDGEPSVPSPFSRELSLNPFINARNIDDFTKIRLQKDDFRLDDFSTMR